MFFERQFRVHMEISPQRDDVGYEFVGNFDGRSHGRDFCRRRWIPSHTLGDLLHIYDKDDMYAQYAEYHQDIRNRRAHAVGIPLIVLGLLGLLSLLRLGPVDLAVLAAVAVLLYYAAIDARGAFISAACFRGSLRDCDTFAVGG